MIFAGARESDNEKLVVTESGPVEFLHKPVSGRALFFAITKALQRHSKFVWSTQSWLFALAKALTPGHSFFNIKGWN